ncbi:MAG: dephospho-CoA kinase [Zetaproteobacteria bacterium]|nr:MAG: dephospho-CoA kinase [Zetaproteobacteria bacterium]
MSAAPVGLTGGIGSGKSTVAGMFAELGVPVLDLDRVGHRVLARPAMAERIAAAFGRRMLAADGTVRRDRLARLVFADAQALRRLNAIVHPEIWQQEECWLAAQHAPFALIEASALIESGAVARMDKVIVVLADETVRRRRVQHRGRPDPSLFDAILARQASDEERRAVADYVLDNQGSMANLRRQVVQLHAQLRAQYALDSDQG